MLKGQAKTSYMRQYMRDRRKAGKLARRAMDTRQSHDRALLDPMLDPIHGVIDGHIPIIDADGNPIPEL